MALHTIIRQKLQAHSVLALQSITSENQLIKWAQSFLGNYYSREVSKHTIVSYRGVLERFLTFMGEKNKVQANDIRLYFIYLKEEGLNSFSIQLHYRILKAWFNWLVREDEIAKSPMTNVTPPRTPQLILEPFTDDDVQKILYCCSGKKFVDVRDRAMVLVLLDTGIRVAELAGIKRSDVSIENETITVIGKGNKQRRVRIGKTAQRAILKYNQMRKDNYPELWLNEERRPMTKDGVISRLNTLTRRAEVSHGKLGPHRFRRTAAVKLLGNGMDVYLVKELFGHASVETTQRYLKSVPESVVLNAHKLASPVDRLNIH